MQALVLQAITFSCKPFDSVSVNRFLEILTADPDAELNSEWGVASSGCFGLMRIIDTEWECGKAFSLPEQLLYQLAAFEPFVFP